MVRWALPCPDCRVDTSSFPTGPALLLENDSARPRNSEVREMHTLAPSTRKAQEAREFWLQSV